MTTSVELVATTALIALMSALGSAVLGYPAGNWLAGTTKRVRQLVTPLLLVPFLLPPFLIGLSLLPLQPLEINSQTGILWIIAAHLTMNIGFMARVVAALAVPAEQIEAAELDQATKFQTRLRIELPQQLPGLTAASLLVALYSATSFGLVLSLGRGQVDTLETEIVQLALRELDLAGAAILALAQTLLTLAMFWLASRLGANPTPLFGYEGSRGSWPGLAVVVATGGSVLLIFWSVTQRAFSLNGGIVENIRALSSQGARDILNVSVLEAASNSLRNMFVTLLIALPLAWFAAGRKRSNPIWLLPIGISPVVVGLAFLVATGYLPAQLSGWWLLPVAQAVFVFPLGYQILRPARAALPLEYLESARLDGASRARVFQLIELPVLAKPLATAAAFSALGSLGEFGAASFLAYGSQTTLPLAIFRLAARPGQENLGMAMTASLLLIVLAMVVVYFVAKESRSDSRPVVVALQ